MAGTRVAASGAAVDERLLAVARRTPGFMPEAEGLALFAAGLEAASAGPLLEIGTYCGKSAVYLGAAARAGSTVLFTVDHHRGSEEVQTGWEHHDPRLVDPRTGRLYTLPCFRRTMEDAGLEHDVVAVVCESAVVAAHWSTPLGLVFVDGGHGREPAHADYDGWAPHVAPGGRLAIHDVFGDPADGGRAPYEIYLRALGSGAFAEEAGPACGSLRVLRRVAPSVVRGGVVRGGWGARGAAALFLALVVAACGGGDGDSRSGGPRTVAGLPAAQADGVVLGLCQAREAAAADLQSARTAFYDRSHGPLHDIARALEPVDRPLATRLLEAKEAAESGVESRSPTVTADLDRLIDVTRAGLVRLSGSPPSCP